MFLYLSKLLFSGFLPFKGDFVRGQKKDETPWLSSFKWPLVYNLVPTVSSCHPPRSRKDRVGRWETLGTRLTGLLNGVLIKVRFFMFQWFPFPAVNLSRHNESKNMQHDVRWVSVFYNAVEVIILGKWLILGALNLFVTFCFTFFPGLGYSLGWLYSLPLLISPQ